MPQAAIKLGAANQIVPLPKMAVSILEALDKKTKK
jgi:hypothetical protein